MCQHNEYKSINKMFNLTFGGVISADFGQKKPAMRLGSLAVLGKGAKDKKRLCCPVKLEVLVQRFKFGV